MAFYNRGVTYRRKGDIDRAIADYSETIRLDPRNAQAFSNRCSARASIGRELRQALDDCSESLRLRPNNANTLDNRGFTYLKLGQIDAALADYEASLSGNPTNPRALYGRGLIRLKKGDGASGDADIAAANAIQADIAEEFAREGVKPDGG
jgi:tetratricopeptide (TPR) repeat protein